MSRAIEDAKSQVEKATQELNSLRDDIGERQKPLAEELESLQAETVRLRREVDTMRARRTQRELAREALAREVESMRNEYDFDFALLQEYRRAFEARQSVAESRILEPRLREIDRRLGAAEIPTHFVAVTEALLHLAEEWNLQKLGGGVQEGDCLDADGTEHTGVFAVLGPVSYFADASDGAAGLVVTRSGSSRPSLFPGADPRIDDAISTLIQGGEAELPVDFTSGDALKVAAGRRSPVDRLAAGGIVMAPLLLIGLVAIFLTVMKVTALRGIRVPEEEVLSRLAENIQSERIEEAHALVESMSLPFRSVLTSGIEYRAVPKDHLEEIMHERALATIPTLDRHLGMLAVLGGVAPLLGLLGTVTGMIHTFELVTIFGTGDAKLLSGGITEALVTTETGLLIAVPVLLIHAYLSRKVRGIVSALEQTVVGFMNRLHGQEIAGS
jgi:biopolymer transport protein ExbB